MKRPVYTALYMLMIVGIFFSLSLIYQSCGKKNPDVPSTEELSEKVEQIADEFTSEEENFFEDDDDEESTIDNEEESSIDQDNYDDNQSNSEESTGSTSSYTPSASQSRTASAGGYIVVAGNYLLESNAGEMVKKLKSAGYSNAEKVVFDLSQYYTVVAGNYENKSLANSVSSELRGKGIDNYVLKRKR